LVSTKSIFVLFFWSILLKQYELYNGTLIYNKCHSFCLLYVVKIDQLFRFNKFYQCRFNVF